MVTRPLWHGSARGPGRRTAHRDGPSGPAPGVDAAGIIEACSPTPVPEPPASAGEVAVADVADAFDVDPALGLTAAEAQPGAPPRPAPTPSSPSGTSPCCGMLREAATEPFVLLLVRRRHRRRPARRGPRRAARPGRPDPDRRRRRRHRVPRRAGARGAPRGGGADRPRPTRRRRHRDRRPRSSCPATSCSPGRRRRPGRPPAVRAERLLARPQRPDRRVGARGRRDRAGSARHARSPTRRSMAYAGTSVVGGRGEGIVVATGAGDRGRPDRRPASAAARRAVARRSSASSTGSSGSCSSSRSGSSRSSRGLGFLRGQPAGENLLAGISAAIAAIPEEPPILLAVILGLGAYRLLRRGVLVRRLNAEETLGAVDLILTDKTGTLTQNRLERRVGVATLDGPIDEPAPRAWPSSAMRCAPRTTPGTRRGGRAPGRSRARSRGPSTRPAATRRSTRPTSSPREPRRATRRPLRRGRVARPDGDRGDAASSARPEAVAGAALGAATARRGRRWLDRVETRAPSGRAARRASRGRPRRCAGPWRSAALIGFADPLRAGIARGARRGAASAGIQIVVVTGDHPATAARDRARGRPRRAERIVARRGARRAGTTSGSRAELPTLHVVARSTPEQKERLVDARARGRPARSP